MDKGKQQYATFHTAGCFITWTKKLKKILGDEQQSKLGNKITYDLDKHNTNEKHVNQLKDDLFQKKPCFKKV